MKRSKSKQKLRNITERNFSDSDLSWMLWFNLSLVFDGFFFKHELYMIHHQSMHAWEKIIEHDTIGNKNKDDGTGSYCAGSEC